MGRLLPFFAIAEQALACESVYIPPCALGSWADQIFVGTALSDKVPFRFKVEEPLKGIAADVKEIEVAPGACGEGYSVGDRYLILSHTPGATNREVVSSSSGTVAFFRALARGEHLTFIQGRIGENLQDTMVTFLLDFEHRPGLAGVEVTASKDGRDYTARSDFNGSFHLPVPEAGKYRLTAKLLGHATLKDAYELEVAADSCEEINLGMWTASGVTGHLRAADGKPAPGIYVELMPRDEEHRPFEVKTGTDGTFEFAKIPSGEYLLGVNISEGLNSELPFAPRFYPGVPDRAAAAVVKISGAQTIEGMDFLLGPRKPTRKIQVAVEWPGGRPVINADVTCRGATADPTGRKRTDSLFRYVDTSGRTEFEVLAEGQFDVEASGLSWEHSGRPVQPIKTRQKITVPAGTETVQLRLVIDQINDISAQEAPMNMSKYNGQDFRGQR